ncbi:MAG: zinc ribbon domain-containing protein [Candidatus Heimdallarchaeota archaeon]
MPKKKEQADVWRPDVYICNDCGHRFAEAEYIQKEEDGIVFQRTVCPECKSEQIRLSSWSEKDFNK